ncbi:MAG TPA: nuclear transport factor 2 family protein [Gemmatimonadaceae bacterium]
MVALTIALTSGSLGAQGLAAVAVPHSGDNPTAIYHAKVREALTTVLQKWTEALEKRDSAAIASAYADNVRSLIGDGSEAVTRSAAVKQLLKTPLAGAQLAITVDDFDMSGEMAFVTCVLVAKTGSADSAPAFVRSVFVFRFDDWHNRWQVREQVLDWRGATSPAQPAQ